MLYAYTGVHVSDGGKHRKEKKGKHNDREKGPGLEWSRRPSRGGGLGMGAGATLTYTLPHLSRCRSDAGGDKEGTATISSGGT